MQAPSFISSASAPASQQCGRPRLVLITQNVAPEAVAELYNFFHSSQEVVQ